MKRLLASLAVLAQFLHPAWADVGDVADFSGLDAVEFYQNRISAADLKGKVVLVEYWGTMCRPCRAVMPEFHAFYEKHKGEDFVFLAVQCQSATSKDILKYLHNNEFTFPACARFSIPQAPIPIRVPETVLVGADGKILAIGSPWKIIPLAEEELRKQEEAQGSDGYVRLKQ